MTDDEMIKIMSRLYNGDKISIKIESFLGGLIELQGTFIGEFKQHGFYSKDGGWGLYSIKKYIADLDEVPCYEFHFKENRKRKIMILKIGFEVKEIKVNET